MKASVPPSSHAASAFHAMALVASARTALAAACAVADRRAGRDASMQEAPSTAAADLAVLAAEIGTMAVQMRLRATVAEPETLAARLAHSFATRLLLADLTRALRTAHQKLLSLYPAVDAETVEAARLLAADAEREATAEGPSLARLAHAVDAWRDGLAAG